MSLGLFIFILGLFLRILAIRTLGELWSFKVELKSSHKVITSGIYKYINHPAYMGNMYLCGITIFLGAFYSTLFSLIFISTFALYRINLEDKFILGPLRKRIDTVQISNKIIAYNINLANKKIQPIRTADSFKQLLWRFKSWFFASA